VRQVTAILWAKLRIVKHTIISVRHESKLKVAVVSVSAVALWFGAFWLFYRGMSWLDRQYSETVGVEGVFSIADLVMTRLLAVFALTLFFMLIFSNVLIVFSTVYKSKEVGYLLQSPMSVRSYFLSRFAECVFISSWASAYLGSPLILAYGLVNGNAGNFFVAAIVFYLPYVAVPAAVGAIITMVLVRIFPRLRTGTLVALSIVAVVIMFFYFRARFAEQRLAEDNVFVRLMDAAATTQSPLLPSYWAAQGVLSAGAGAWGEAAFYFLCLTSTALMALWLAAEVAQLIFYDGWSYIMGQDRQKVRRMGWGVFGMIERGSRGLGDPHRALTLKDIKLFWRDTTQWSQFVIFFGLMAIYIANLRPSSAAMDDATWRTMIISLNIGACSLILATLTSRFVFPLVSLEGRRFWILGLAPLTTGQLVWQKFWLSVVATSLFTIGLVVLSCIKLQVDAVAFFLSVYTIVITNFALSGLAVGLGSLYPNFQEDNPARIVSGMGGTLNFLLSMGYIVMVVGAQTALLQGRIPGMWLDGEAFWPAMAVVVAFITVISLTSWLVPMRLGLRNLRQMEF